MVGRRCLFYVMGFANALTKWRSLLRPAGSMAISEIVWFRKDPPGETLDYWATEAPGMTYYEDNFRIIHEAGYRVTGYFPLPDESWWLDYYSRLKGKLAGMRKEYQDNPAAGELCDSFQAEIEIHRKYSAFFGYGFCVMKKSDSPG